MSNSTVKKGQTFDQFTNLYSLSKTLRFELKPVGSTSMMLEAADVFAKDKLIHDKYEKTKPYFDRLHREFVDEALSEVSLSGAQEYLDSLRVWEKDKKNVSAKKAWEQAIKNLRKEVVLFFNSKAEEWAKEKYADLGLKNKDIELLFEEDVFALLKRRYGGEVDTFIEVAVNDESGQSILDSDGSPKMEKKSIFDSWKGFTGYFTKFFATRKNFYEDDGKAGRIATRIVDQNLKRFCDNLQVFNSLKEKISFEEVEKNFNVSLSDVFDLLYYDGCLLQSGIDSYNAILGADSRDQNKRGINQLINEYRQKNKGEKVPFLKALDKQILSEKTEFLEGIKNDEELLRILGTFNASAEKKIGVLKKVFKEFTGHWQDYNLSQIYISNEAFNTISRRWTGETEVWERWLFESMKSDKLAKFEKKDNSYKFPDFIPLSFLQESLDGNEFSGFFWKDRYVEIAEFQDKSKWEQFLMILMYEFESLLEREITIDGKNKLIGYAPSSQEFARLLEKGNDVTPEMKVVIKDFADSVLTIYQLAKYFAVEKKKAWLSEYDLDVFYTHPDWGYLCFYGDAYEEIVKVYNDLRNYLTKKLYSEEKWKLNFENPTLANGWDKNKEADNSAVMLRKDGKYYLGVMGRGHNQLFSDKYQGEALARTGEESYEKMVYKFFPDQAKMFPKVCFSAKGVEFFKPSDDVLRIYNNVEFKKGDTFSLSSMHTLINFYKDCLRLYPGWGAFTFNHLKKTEEYQDNIGEFFRDVGEDAYRIDFQPVSERYINEKNRALELYLFEIHNKDWNDGAIGHKNLHSLYFESCFSKSNAELNFLVKLNGQAELFYRPKTDKLDKVPVVTKKGISLNKGQKALKKNRYTENKIFFHVPLTFNRTKGTSFRFNAQVNDFLANNPVINIIGVDRGEKHLAYYSVITQKGETLESGSLNVINGVDYAALLGERAKNREQARKDWQAVEGIKDLKKGYISQVVRRLADLAIKHNAIIVFEDLNVRFKQIRGGIEKSVYQQLEKALIEKLCFLVNKGETDSTKAGHLLRAYQLAAPFESFKDMGKQTGIIFYTQAAYTSRIDPVTGWRPHLYLKYANAERAKVDILKFSKIVYENGSFEFEYDIKKFQEAKEYPKNTIWIVSSNVERFRWSKDLNQNKGGYTHYKNLTDGIAENKNPKSTKPDNLKDLFEKYGIDIAKDIKSQIQELETKGNEKFFEHLIFFFNLICQIRNTDDSESAKKEGKDDFILSPVKPFFDSRYSEKFGKSLPHNGDDNGAYNIARKGVLIMDKIGAYAFKHGGCEKLGWGDLYVSPIDWDNYAFKTAD